MKKSYLMIAATATLLAACTSNDSFREIANQDVMIGFETFHEKSTKAQATDAIDSSDDLTSAHGGFGVWGYKGDPDDIKVYGSSTASENMDDLAGDKYTKVFENVKVWYDATTSASQNHKHFTYAVPKYWDKTAEYVFFAYAPWDKDNAGLNTETGQITISDIAGIQDVSTKTGSTGSSIVYTGSTTTAVTDYLMATYVTEMKYKGTNQSSQSYSDKDQTVAFTFGHMLSKLQVNLSSKEAYSGVKELIVTYLSIENMPALGTNLEKTEFTQTSPTAAAGTYAPNYYDETLEIINSNSTNDANANASSQTALYILFNGQAGATAEAAPSAPTKQTQSFNYYVAPNAPANNSNTANQKHLLNVSYTINYVDNTTEDVVLEDIDISEQFATMLQNNSYILNIKIALNEILFTASVTSWEDDTTLDDVIAQ